MDDRASFRNQNAAQDNTIHQHTATYRAAAAAQYWSMILSILPSHINKTCTVASNSNANNSPASASADAISCELAMPLHPQAASVVESFAVLPEHSFMISWIAQPPAGLLHRSKACAQILRLEHTNTNARNRGLALVSTGRHFVDSFHVIPAGPAMGNSVLF